MKNQKYIFTFVQKSDEKILRTMFMQNEKYVSE